MEGYFSEKENTSKKKKTAEDKGSKGSKRKRLFRIATLALWLFFLGGLTGFWILLEQVKSGKFGELPSSELIENPENPLATVVITRDGVELGKYFTENRTNVSYKDLSPYLIQALIATEDERFKSHAGIDFRSLFRVAFRSVLMGDQSGGGGSTLSQQLAKNLYELRQEHRDNNMLIKKLQEWVLAVRLERKYTKQEILTMYLNTVDFLNNSFGIHAAAKTYFNKTPAQLNAVESAALVGMLKATYRFNPKSNPENNKERRVVVFKQMKRNGFIDDSGYDSLINKELALNFQETDHNVGQAPYFREHLRQFLHRWQRKKGYNIYRDGLKIYTTLDSRVQAHAEKAVREHMVYLQEKFFEHWEGRKVPWVEGVSLLHQVQFSQRYNWLIKKCRNQYDRRPTEEDIKKEFTQEIPMSIFTYKGEIDTVMTPLDSVRYYKHFLQPGMMAMEPGSGHILAWVGGLNHKHFKYDHVNKRSKRQVGSTFKPFVYLSGIEAGYYPCQTAPNIPVVFDNLVTGVDKDGKPIMGTWDARNSDGKYGGEMRLRQGLATSTNTITAWVMKQLDDPAIVLKKAALMGIETENIEPVPSLCLGTAEISVYEMVGAFNTFNNNGLWVEPIFITKIEDAHGNVIERFIPESREAVDKVINYAMVKMLETVVRRGTGMRLISSGYYNIQTPLAGKTGTTQNAADGWFIGFEPGITAGVWVGGEENSVAFRNMQYGQGARMAMPVFGNFINAINADSSLNYGEVKEWAKPDADLPFELDCPFIEYDPDNPGGGNESDDPFDFSSL